VAVLRAENKDLKRRLAASELECHQLLKRAQEAEAQLASEAAMSGRVNALGLKVSDVLTLSRLRP
jgi:hypothetical protein